MADTLDVLILSGHMTREHDNEFRSFRQHNIWLTTLLEDTGRFRVRVIEDPRGLGAEIIDKYDVVVVVFEGRDGYFDTAVGFGPETDAALLRFVHQRGKGMVWFHGSAAQEDDWGYPEEYNVMRGAKLSVPTGLRPRPWGEAQLETVEPRHPITEGISDRWTVTGDDILTGVELYEGTRVLLTTFDDLESYERAPTYPMPHYPVAVPDEGLAALPGMNTDQPIAWINQYGAGRCFTITIGHDIDTFRRIEFIRMFPRGVEWAATGAVTLSGPDRRGERRFLPWPYYNREG
ncbi:ThuA domain-containing protein [Amnibacterium sp.]|uniref:ThuA domain-containing protein n=1 Tax=Amnibacterium sp. TaxID=1872496 RepID=UPI003F7C67B6